MKYFIDTEFHEGFHKPLIGKNRHFIDLISIGIVAEDGREYYAISKDFDIKAAWNAHDLKETGTIKENKSERTKVKEYWLRDNVLKSIWKEMHDKEHYVKRMHPDLINPFSFKSLSRLVNWQGKPNNQIAKEIVDFVNGIHPKDDISSKVNPLGLGSKRVHNNPTPIEFYGYYADYDWVVFCSLFGKMMNLPRGFPMYCKDLKQSYDEQEVGGIYDYPFGLKSLKDHNNYPKQTNEHNALADAKWNYELYKFLKSI